MRHWLMKSEPGTYSIDDLARDGRTEWEGVRNFQARNYMRDEMREGDAVLFYHSSAEPPGVAGLARVVGASHPDLTALDPRSKYYDPKATAAAPIWALVDVEHVATFPRVVALDELKAHPGLEELWVLRRGSRLSITPVDPAHYEIICALAREPAPLSVAPSGKARAAIARGTKAKPAAKPRRGAQPKVGDTATPKAQAAAKGRAKADAKVIAKASAKGRSKTSAKSSAKTKATNASKPKAKATAKGRAKAIAKGRSKAPQAKKRGAKPRVR